LQQPTNDGLLRSVDDLHNSCFWATFTVQSGHPCNDTVSVNDSTHFVGRQINIYLPVITLHKTMAITVTLYRSLESFKKSSAWS
jgi:hypothetical protein